ncbi:rRNA maturation RNase YbeY [Nitrosovibrio sp. Nv6]|uniref:rRNA maturation RNase YbeY n=1 Tax=Nitrosovibrio sp. Nv6 TaxID=1855340 RepID=UPI0008D5695B|nr:rRNA maturation RNase YbeY [Nitrosovibrio sp. Nv6]SEP40952.1 probable rRNA maturation factor [Nitrosovibrio sp. Nv6]
MKKKSSASDSPGGVACQEVKSTKLKLTAQYATGASDVPPRSAFRTWIKAALTQDAEIVLRIVDEAEGRSLNRDFRDRDYATNVLTFVYDAVAPDARSGPRSNGERLSGDIVLCAPVIENEAGQQHKSLAAHYAHLTIHGVLHLQGYDHENDADAAVMEQLEIEILGRLGYKNPYREHQWTTEEH